MTTPPEDPFAIPPRAADGEPPALPQENPPGVLAPGMLVPGAPDAPAPPPPMAAPPLGMATGWTPERPTALAIAAIALTGLYALAGMVGGLRSQASVDSLRAGASGGTVTSSPLTAATGMLSLVAGIAGFAMLALWMSRIRKNLLALGITAGGPPAVEWWGWFVPFANFVLPLLGMRAIAHRKVSMGFLLGWWIPFCLVWLLQGASSLISFSAIDFSTGQLRDPAALDAMVPLGYVSSAFMLISWVFLMAIIRRVTAVHLED